MTLVGALKDSFLRLPLATAVWTAAILAPVNLAAFFFLDEPFGWLVALLVAAGLLPNLPIMVRARGFTTAMGVPHTIAWIPLLVLIALLLLLDPGELSTAFTVYLVVLFATDAVSLYFDVPDTVKALRGEQTVY